MRAARRRFLQTLAFAGAAGWLWPAGSKAWQFGLDFGAIAGNAMAQVFSDIIEGMISTVLFIPLLLVDAFLDGVARVLHLDSQQVAKIKAHREELKHDLANFSLELASKPESERTRLMLGEFQRLAPKYRQHVMAILRPEQRHRLEQLERQLQGVQAMVTDDGRKQLALTDEQFKQLDGVAKLLRDKVDRLKEGHEHLSPLAVGRMFLMRKVADLESQQILTPEQQTKWHAYAGEPIHLGQLIPWDKIVLELEPPKSEKPAGK
ncbi:MAG: hypothetical protein JSS27_12075 [Planctomycetes bacterium]|nr:hypothetical protein [Planctomycetota bacterium]